jgi:hypothetical protein
MKVNVNRVIGLIPAKFTCECLNDNGELEAVEIGLKLNRLKFRDVAREQFTDAMSKADKDPEVIGQLLADLIAEWEFYADDECIEMLPITVENIIDRDALFVMNLAEAVLGKLFPNPLKAANLVNGSEPAAKSSLASATNSEIATSSQPLAVSGTSNRGN